MIAMRFRLREMMRARGLATAYALAKASGGRIPLTTAARLVGGAARRIDFATIDALCDVLDADPGELFERETPSRSRAKRKE